ncbi:hypothetical protein PENSPDRAFT_575908 [Peniophora sp. CONT]|nr:hypothetical protein PENSPDRAFT_575908 [Peniophora sp. CONT]
MAETLLNAAGKRMFAKHMESYRATDPLYEEYTDAKGRVKRRKRDLPTGLSDADLKILRSVNRRAHYLDKGFRICGIRFGWTFVIGIIPGVGDAVDAILGYTLVINKAKKAGLPAWLIQRMLFNLAIGTGVGFVPILGDVVLAMWRANSRNAALLEEFLRQRAAGNTDDKGRTLKGKKKSGNPAPDNGRPAPTQPSEEEVPGGQASTVKTTARPGTAKSAPETGPKRSSSGSGRWTPWRRTPSKEKEVAATQRRDSRFVEDLDNSPPKTPRA